MNYLGHFVYNHSICNLEPRPYFVLGVALPDLWPRFSRRRRIHWKSVRESLGSDTDARDLRAGLLNHVDVDRLFHHLPTFVRWQRELKLRVGGQTTHSALLDFMVHLTLELMLDHRLAVEQPQVCEEFYDRISACDTDRAEQSVGRLGKVDSRGLGGEIEGFIRRRYLTRFTRRETLPEVIEYVLSLMHVSEQPHRGLIRDLLANSIDMVVPAAIWSELLPASRPQPRPVSTHDDSGADPRVCTIADSHIFSQSTYIP